MSKSKHGPRNRDFSRPPDKGSGLAPSKVATSKLSPQPSRRGKTAMRLAAILVPVLLLALVEVVLRLAGYGYSTRFLRAIDGAQAFTINDEFVRQFYKENPQGKSFPFLLPAEKSSDTIRIFVLGESAALGTPNPSFGFARIVEVFLRAQFPAKKFEVLNAAMRGINSHIIVPIARDCAAHQPDLFIVYMGNNEAVGLHAPGPETTLLDRHRILIRLMQAARSSKLGQLLAALGSPSRRPAQGMDFFRAHRMSADDPRRESLYQNFRANLEDICERISRSGAKAVVSTIPVNLKDFPPLASLHRRGLAPAEEAQWQAHYDRGIAAESEARYPQALDHYQAAARLDDHFADLHFRTARCHFALGQFPLAREHYGLASDWDALQVRADGRINGIIREVAGRNKERGVLLLESEQAVAQSDLSDHQTPGGKVFVDHVHLRFAGDYWVARTLYPAVVSALSGKLGEATNTPLPTLEACAGRLAYNDWDDLQIDLSFAQQMAGPPFLDQLDHTQRLAQAEQAVKQRSASFTRQDLDRAVQSYRAALARHPDDWHLHNSFGMLSYATRDFGTAVEQFGLMVKQFPDWLMGRITLAGALAKAGKNQDAIVQLKEALRIDPNFRQAQQSLATLTGRRERSQ